MRKNAITVVLIASLCSMAAHLVYADDTIPVKVVNPSLRTQVISEPSTPRNVNVVNEPSNPRDVSVISEPMAPRNVNVVGEPATPRDVNVLGTVDTNIVSPLPLPISFPCGTEEIVSAFAQNVGNNPVALYAVPAGKKLIITDLIITLVGTPGDYLRVQDSSGIRTEIRGPYPVYASFNSGIPINSNNTVSVKSTGAASIYEVTMTGKLVGVEE